MQRRKFKTNESFAATDVVLFPKHAHMVAVCSSYDPQGCCED